VRFALYVILLAISLPSIAHETSSCAQLTEIDFAAVEDAPTQLTAATVTQTADGSTEFCHVVGYVAPNIGIELGLPANWNGKLFESGCAGYCGATFFSLLCDGVIQKGYACIASDAGHRADFSYGLWAYNNLQDEASLGYRAAHVVALAGKAIVARLYGSEARKSYFAGCSTGGRQALVEAQRFPWDFDGIIAGAPSISVTGVHMQLLWNQRAMAGPGGEPLLKPTDLEFLHAAVIAQCDANDGIKDGVIGDPRRCHMDVESLRCKTNQTHQCLTPTQIEAVRKIYSGPRTSRGEPLLAGGVLPGSELTWTEWFVGWRSFARDEFRFSAFRPNPGPRWESKDFIFDHDYRRFGEADTLYSANNPDLRRFKAAGGKLLSFIGWEDTGGPGPVIDYYETVEKTMGGPVATRDFFRLFVIPGMDHCTDGPGPFAVDYLNALETWVEQGTAPERLIGAHETVERPGDWDKFWAKFPLPRERVSFSRPIYPYPLEARYNGTGNPDEAASFHPISLHEN